MATRIETEQLTRVVLNLTAVELEAEVRVGFFAYDSANMILYYGDPATDTWLVVQTGEPFSPPDEGTGPAGIYVEDFETDTGEWVVDNSQDAGGTTLRRDTGGTPTNNTGPASAHSGSWYVYTEASGNKNNTSYLTTSYFKALTEVRYWRHMYGSATGTVRLQYATDRTSPIWTDLAVHSGALQTDETDAYTEEVVSTVGLGAEVIRFVFEVGNGKRSDMALDLIQLTSV